MYVSFFFNLFYFNYFKPLALTFSGIQAMNNYTLLVSSHDFVVFLFIKIITISLLKSTYLIIYFVHSIFTFN